MRRPLLYCSKFGARLDEPDPVGRAAARRVERGLRGRPRPRRRRRGWLRLGAVHARIAREREAGGRHQQHRRDVDGPPRAPRQRRTAAPRRVERAPGVAREERTRLLDARQPVRHPAQRRAGKRLEALVERLEAVERTPDVAQLLDGVADRPQLGLERRERPASEASHAGWLGFRGVPGHPGRGRPRGDGATRWYSSAANPSPNGNYTVRPAGPTRRPPGAPGAAACEGASPKNRIPSR